MRLSSYLAALIMVIALAFMVFGELKKSITQRVEVTARQIVKQR